MRSPLILPLGDRAALVRFADALEEEANARAVAFARQFGAKTPRGVDEVVPNLVSVLVRYDPQTIDFAALCDELRLGLALPTPDADPAGPEIAVPVHYGGDRRPRPRRGR